MLCTVPPLISLWRGTLVIFRLEGLSHTVCARPSRKKVHPCRRKCCSKSRSFMCREVSCLDQVDRLTQCVWRQVLFRNFALTLQHQLERIEQVRLCLFQGFALRDGSRNLLNEASVPTLLGRLKNRCQFHPQRISRRALFGKLSLPHGSP